MILEWDETKRLSNLAKHHLDFADLLPVFKDPNKIEEIDDRKDYGEIRCRTIGLLCNEVVVVVIHTDRKGVTRIISARIANKKEKKIYYGTC